MANGSGNEVPEVRIPPPLVLLAAILAGVLLGFVAPLPGGFMVPPPLSYWIGGIVILVSFAGLALWAVRDFRRAHEDPLPRTPVNTIVETGPYRFSRNPMYVSFVLICLGFAILLGNVWILIFTPVVAIVIHYTAILPEEAYLEHKFGDAYRAYKGRVRRWL